MTDKPAPPTSRFLWVNLDAQVTHDFCMYQGKAKAYALLHRNGGYLMGENGPVVTASWDEATKAAGIYGADCIVIFHEEKIKHARRMPAGGITWDRVLYALHVCAIDYPLHMPETTKEPDAYGRSQTSLRKAAARARAKHKKRLDEIRNQRKEERFNAADRNQWGPPDDEHH